VGWSFDVGNRLSQASSLHNIPTVGFTYCPDDTLLSETYDGNGNVTATGGKTFSYDSQNELISANGGAVTVMYDGFGNRVSKTANGVTTKYVNPTGYPQVFDELTGSTVTRTYTYGLQRISEDQPIDNVWTPSFYGYDGFGTVRQLTNAAGAVTDTFEYDAFGNAITHRNDAEQLSLSRRTIRSGSGPRLPSCSLHESAHRQVPEPGSRGWRLLQSRNIAQIPIRSPVTQ
jgi:YD repeat-containing protein